ESVEAGTVEEPVLNDVKESVEAGPGLGSKAEQGSLQTGDDDDEDLISHLDTISLLKEAADHFCLKLAGSRSKLVGKSGSLFLSHLYTISDLEGWLNCDVINEWAKDLDQITPDTKVLENGFMNSMRENSTRLQGEPTKLEEWWRKYWFKPGVTRASRDCGNDWTKSKHAELFKLIQVWLERVFLTCNTAYNWDEWKFDPCPKKDISDGENEEGLNDSDWEELPASEEDSDDGSVFGVSSPLTSLVDSTPVVAPRRSTRNKKQ
ncbi:hypothetical protein B0H15DRAFT_802414, partial [Mycena belliarum]